MKNYFMNKGFSGLLSSFLIGLLFGFGLSLSEMTNPARVLGFLDITGKWDPTLLFVMVGALLVSVPCFQLLPKLEKPLFEKRFNLPTLIKIDLKLIIGAILFGIGWGLAGLCPGPSFVALVTFKFEIILFMLSMLTGITLYHLFFE